MLNQSLQIPTAWLLLTTRLKRSKGLILVLGASDTGKTTLCQYLLEKFYEAHLKVCFIDSDMGQSSIGPPAAIDLVRITKRPSSYFGSPMSHLMYFIGATSPQGHSLETLVGLKKLVDLALAKPPDIILIDTTSFIYGAEAERLKFSKIALLRPQHIVALQQSDEIEHILQPQRNNKPRKIYRLKPAPAVVNRSQEKRQRYREALFSQYFQQARLHHLSLHLLRTLSPPALGEARPPRPTGAGLWRQDKVAPSEEDERAEEDERVISPFPLGLSKEVDPVGDPAFIDSLSDNEHLLDNFLVGLENDAGITQALGVIQKVELTSQKALVLSPIKYLSRIKSVRLGRLKITPAGKEIG